MWIKNSLFILAAIVLFATASCVTYDSRIFEPTDIELRKSQKVRYFGPGESVTLDKCYLLGQMKLNEMEGGNSPSTVAVRKYPDANYVVHINSRTDGGIDGEFDAGFYIVLDCGIFK